ncbi:phage protein [Yersinia pseudotuberculosis]|uniref:hypothetical protein n=1 Tax=Yersinia pseudotuberculosis TaxID=633 RepID=UPI0005AD399F|nr:hypothetical protein [Yersinia pseudotuberculosis]AJJ05311.1 hypothetical protein BZ20_3900 [Yersinia pseudotuberculosis]CNC67854.1 phage protein [Yersinia pseudotuberculosis]CNK54554.1 phage protein [Yersinia pseudotuberculosis]
MAWYRSGTVTSEAAQNIVTGTGTQWANNVMGVAPGMALFIPDSAGNTLIYEILAVDSNTQIRINGNIKESVADSSYAIMTTVSNSYSALARETSAQLAMYQQLLKNWQQITTGTGDVNIIAPDGSVVIIPSLNSLMPKSGGAFTGPVSMFHDATDPLEPVTFQQFKQTGGELATQITQLASRTTVLESDSITTSKVMNTPWISPTLINGWVKPASRRCAYRKVLGLVFVEMTVNSGASDTTIFVLPPGYRPQLDTNSFVAFGIGADNTPPRVTVDVSGNVIAHQMANPAVGVEVSFYFSPVIA